MKKSLLVFGAVLASASCVMAQGTLNYSTRAGATPNNVLAHVYLGALGETSRTGNTAGEFPAGTQTYGGGVLAGTGYSAQLFYAVGLNQAESSLLVAGGSLTTFRTGATLGGTIAPSFLTLTGTSVGGDATLQLRAWNNLNGTLTTWDLASAAALQGLTQIGKSSVFNISGLVDNLNPTPPNMLGFTSFNITAVPEPSSFLLGGIGAAALLIFRRRK